jgi:hypothetical protein
MRSETPDLATPTRDPMGDGTNVPAVASPASSVLGPASLGRLERVVNLRAYWPNEERDFTPWLAQAENLELLADAIGIGELILLQTERKVGPFEADIYAKEASSETIVVVENQLGRTDHGHLGKLLVSGRVMSGHG